MNERAKADIKRRNVALFALTFIFATIPAVLTSHFGFGFSPILSGSMEPAAAPGDLFLTRLVEASTLQVGDIIAIDNQITGTYYSHRIIEIRTLNGALRIITKGDANQSADRDPFMVAPLGKVSKATEVIPYLGTPMVYMNTVQGRQSAATFLVLSNILALFLVLFRKRIFPQTISERVYRDLYSQERQSNQQYRELIENLQESLAIAGREKREVEL